MALQADNTDISADPDHLPLITAAGVLFLQSDYITEINFQHKLDFPFVIPVPLFMGFTSAGIQIIHIIGLDSGLRQNGNLFDYRRYLALANVCHLKLDYSPSITSLIHQLLYRFHRAGFLWLI